MLRRVFVHLFAIGIGIGRGAFVLGGPAPSAAGAASSAHELALQGQDLGLEHGDLLGLAALLHGVDDGLDTRGVGEGPDGLLGVVVRGTEVYEH